MTLVPTLELKPYTTIRKKRELPVEGIVHVKENAMVNAAQCIASAKLPGSLYISRVSDELGLSHSELSQVTLVEEGQSVNEGALLAKKVGLFGLFSSEVRAPKGGIIEFVSEASGHIGIRGEPKSLELLAHIPGKVVSVIPKRGVEIEFSGAFLQGVFGVGGEKVGTLLTLDISSGEIVRPDHIPEDCGGRILCGGCAPTIEALKKASANGAVGFVTGSLTDHVLNTYLGYELSVAVTGNEKLSMSVIATEGFGIVSIGERFLEILKKYSGREASLSGATQVRAGAVRPEVCIAHTDVIAPSSVNELEIGSRVRIVRYPYFGELGTVTGLPVDVQLVESGAKVRVAEIETSGGKRAVVPRTNIEVL